jgi:uncharacterized protein (DUF433 family)
VLRFDGSGSYRGCLMETFDRITINPEVCLGQATVRGMRITVSFILKMLASGQTVSEILQAYPFLEEEDIMQSLQYGAWLASDQRQLVKSA